TAQNTQGVFGIHDIPLDFIRQQISLVMEDIGADAFKTGMLSTGAIISTVAEGISPYTDHTPFVLDPVMFAKGGAALLQPDAIDLLKSKLVPLARIITPNIPEAEHLSGIKIHDVEGMKQAARK